MNKKKFKDKLYEVNYIRDLKDMMTQSVEMYGDSPAFSIKDKELGKFIPISYRRFGSDVNSLGTAMLSMGLKGERIAILGENSYNWVVNYFAIACGVGVVVPIDRELSAVDIAGLIKMADVTTICVSSKSFEKIAEAVSQLENIKMIIAMDENEKIDLEVWDRNGDIVEIKTMKQMINIGLQRIGDGDVSYKEAKINPKELSTILFSSGTTAMAKGIMLSQDNLVANIMSMSRYVKVGQGDVGLSVLPMHHTYEMTCHIMTGIYKGITIAICEGLRYIQKNMSEANVTIMLSVPLIFETIYKRIWKTATSNGKDKQLRKMINFSKKFKLYNNPSIVKKIFRPLHDILGGKIRLLIAGGAAIDPAVVEDFEAMGFPMIQGYGMTENAPIIAVNKDRYSKASAVGIPLEGTEVKILYPNEDGIGEIICKGPSVMLGYLDKPIETDETIIDGWLHTGDLGYFDKEGFLYVSGRKKNVIVTKNGKNIFPEELEFQLSGNNYINSIMIHGEDDERSGDIIVKAEIYPNYDLIEEERGHLSDEGVRAIFKEIIDEYNENMPTYKRIKKFGIRRSDFEKTTTRKIKRHLKENLDGSQF